MVRLGMVRYGRELGENLSQAQKFQLFISTSSLMAMDLGPMVIYRRTVSIPFLVSAVPICELKIQGTCERFKNRPAVVSY
jgi:hypothetical protein